MYRRDETMVFLAMTLFSVCILLCVIVESARTTGTRCYLWMVVDSSANSPMAQYYWELWNRYRILGLEYGRAETLEKGFREFMGPYMEAENWYPMKAEQIRITDMTDLTQGDGRYFKQEILDYMKYGLLGADQDELDEADALELLEVWREGDSINRVSELYAAHSREVVKVEKVSGIINSTLLAQREWWGQGKGCLDQLDGRRSVSQANKLMRKLERLPGQANSYGKRADGLYEKLADSRERFSEKASDLSEDMRAGLEEEVRQYEVYAAQDGQRRGEVEAPTNPSRDRVLWIRDVAGMTEAVMEYVSSWELEDEDDELDEDALRQPVRARWFRYDMPTLGVEFGIRDKEKKGFLEQVGSTAGREMLELVLPEGTVVSETVLRFSDTPSVRGETNGGGWKETDQNRGSKNIGLLTGVRTLVQRLLIEGYDIRFFKRSKKGIQEGEFYELEYAIHGKKKDRDNLSDVAARPVVFREGLNLVHILSDTGKRRETRNLVLTTVGGTGILSPVSVMVSFIMAVWALGEALLDVWYLPERKRAPIFKTGSDWKLGLAGLLEMGKSGSPIDEEGGNKSGTDYEDYLRILIFGAYDTDLVYRMMDVTQIITAVRQPGSSLVNYVCTVDAEAPVSGKHASFSNGLWKSRGRKDGYAYDTRMAVVGSYLKGYESP